MSKKKATIRSIYSVSRGVPIGARVTVADNSGAQVAQIIGVKKIKTRLRRLAAAHVGDLVIVTIKKGSPKMRRQIVHAVLIRQRKPYRRADGTWIQFEDNAVIITNESGEPRATVIRGPVAREAASKWPRISSQASFIV